MNEVDMGGERKEGKKGQREGRRKGGREFVAFRDVPAAGIDAWG